MRRWLMGSSGPADPLLAADELAAVQEASAQAAWAMNDEVDRAEEALAKGTSPFHKVRDHSATNTEGSGSADFGSKLGYGAALFWKGLLTFDKETMIKATTALNVAEEVASEHFSMVVRDPSTGHQSKIYPTGAEYLLCQAVCQLLLAILGILKASWTESLAGLNKLRKGYSSLSTLHAAEKAYVAAHPPPGTTTRGSHESATNDTQSTRSVSSGKTTVADAIAVASGTTHIDFRTVSSDPIDQFIHSGTAMIWGLIKVLLSTSPPAIQSLLSLFSFRGDRVQGLQLLWDATDFKDNIFGAIASLVVIIYNHVVVALSDITREDALPQEKLRSLLRELRTMYPDSQLWLTMLAREAAAERDLKRALKVLEDHPTASFGAIQKLREFELSIDLLFLHRFEESAEAHLACMKENNWSQAVYRYNAATCYIELYRDHKSSDPEKAKVYAEKVHEMLAPVPELSKKKFVMGRQLAFDEFIGVKVSKWQARSKERGCDLVDAIGVSPLEEVSYLWTGYRRLQPDQLQVSIDRLEAHEKQPEWEIETADERAAHYLLKAIAIRNMGKPLEAQELIRDRVLSCSQSEIKASPHPTDYVLPIAHYELAVCLWEDGGKDKAPIDTLRQVRDEVEKSGKWETYSLEDRMTQKLAAARATLTSLGA